MGHKMFLSSFIVLLHSCMSCNEVPFVGKWGACVSLSCEPPDSDSERGLLINLGESPKSQSSSICKRLSVWTTIILQNGSVSKFCINKIVFTVRHGRRVLKFCGLTKHKTESKFTMTVWTGSSLGIIFCPEHVRDMSLDRTFVCTFQVHAKC
jgi:hypothetical protein